MNEAPGHVTLNLRFYVSTVKKTNLIYHVLPALALYFLKRNQEEHNAIIV
jgi:hypothetical protein